MGLRLLLSIHRWMGTDISIPFVFSLSFDSLDSGVNLRVPLDFETVDFTL